VIGNVGLPGWFVATRLRVILKQPNSRGMPGSFLAIFSAVHRLDVCPVGNYNRRMRFLRGTGEFTRSFDGRILSRRVKIGQGAIQNAYQLSAMGPLERRWA